MSYEEIRARLAEIYGWTFETIDNMSFEQIDSAANQGKQPKGIPVESHAQADEIHRNWRQYVGV